MATKGLFKKVVNLVTVSSFLLWNLASALPQGGAVAQGSATISNPTSTQTVINQTSQNAVINWTSFNTSQPESVRFNQPNASSIALNRITNGLPTSFAGSLSANGQVWILNPAGVVFGAHSTVDVSGLLVTTHNISDANFMAGNYQFNLADPNSTASVINGGTITIEDDGIAALVAPNVVNNGTIVANLGKVSLSTGSEYVLDMYGDSLINFGTNSPIANGSVSNTGNISATGGKVYMTANTASGILDNVISMSGTIAATTASTGQHGEIILNGGHAGAVKVSGKLDASNGGKIETSGYALDLSGATIDAGVGGTWLIDPSNVMINASATSNTDTLGTNPITYAPSTGVATSNVSNADIEGQLNGGTDVIVTTSNNGASGGVLGDLTVAAPILVPALGGAGSLTLTADRNVIINQPITINGNLTVNAAQTTLTGNIQIGANITTGGTQAYNGPVLLTANNLTLTSGAQFFQGIVFSSTLDGAENLTINASDTAGTVTFNGVVGGMAPLDNLTITSPIPNTSFPFIFFNTSAVTTTGNQQYFGQLELGQDATFTANGFIDFAGNVVSSGSPANLTATANNYVEFDAVVNSVNNLFVNTPEVIFNSPGYIQTMGNQFYTGVCGLITCPTSIILEQNMDGGGSGGLEANEVGGTIITLNGPVTSVGGNFNLYVIAENAYFYGDVGDGVTPLGNFTVNATNIYIEPTATSITTVGFQGYSYEYPTTTFLIVLSPATFTGSNISINMQLLLAQDTTFTANGVGPVDGNISFQTINSTTPVNLIVNPNSAAGGSAQFGGNIGATFDGLDNPNDELASLTVNGTSIITDGEGDPIYFYTVGSQTYTDTVTLNLNVGGGGIASGVYMYSTNPAPSPVGTNAITFGTGPSGTDIGVVEGTNGPQVLTVVTNNPNNGPFVSGGQGITGSVDVTSLTVGGPGGAMISSAANPNSIVGGAGGSGARVNTMVSPDFSSVPPDAVYCVNGFFGCSAQPPIPVNNFPNNIPPTQIFEIPYPPYFCDLTNFECKHVEYIFRDLIVGNVTTIEGSVKAVRMDGSVHWLKKGDYIYSYEKVSSGNRADVHVFMYSSGDVVEVPGSQSKMFLLDETK